MTARVPAFGHVGQMAEKKLSNDNDIKIIITGKNSQTGIGKTTLAIQLCRFIDDDWSAEERAFVDVQEYQNAYLDQPPGSALLLDEIEAGADSRRAMSQENVELSQAWATLRARNIATICTLPTTSMLDNRMTELADYWILVEKRGLALPHKIVVNDYKPSRDPSKQKLPGEERIQFRDLPDDDPDKQYLDNIKDELVRGTGRKYISERDHEEEVEEARENAHRECRDAWLRELVEKTDMGPTDLAELDVTDVGRSRIQQIISDD